MSCHIRFSHGSFAHSEHCFHSRFQLNVAGLPCPVRESTTDELLEELENPSQYETPKLSLESLLCSLDLELHTSAIIQLNFVHSSERSIDVMLKPFDLMSVPALSFCSLDSCAGVQARRGRWRLLLMGYW